MVIILLTIYLIFSNFGLLFIKLGSTNSELFFVNRMFGFKIDLFLGIGLIMYVVSFLLWIYILNKFNLSYIFPIVSGLSQCITLIIAVTILHESVNNFQFSGIVVIVLGILLMNIKS